MRFGLICLWLLFTVDWFWMVAFAGLDWLLRKFVTAIWGGCFPCDCCLIRIRLDAFCCGWFYAGFCMVLFRAPVDLYSWHLLLVVVCLCGLLLL